MDTTVVIFIRALHGLGKIIHVPDIFRLPTLMGIIHVTNAIFQFFSHHIRNIRLVHHHGTKISKDITHSLVDGTVIIHIEICIHGLSGKAVGKLMSHHVHSLSVRSRGIKSKDLKALYLTGVKCIVEGNPFLIHSIHQNQAGRTFCVRTVKFGASVQIKNLDKVLEG